MLRLVILVLFQKELMTMHGKMIKLHSEPRPAAQKLVELGKG